MSLVGALRASLTLDSAEFVKGANKAQKSGKKLEGGLAALGGAMRKVGIGLAVATAGLGAAIKGQLNAADKMGEAAEKFGVPVEELSRLAHAAKIYGVEFNSMGISLQQLSKKMVAAAEGGKAQAKMFEDIGVAVTDADGKLRSTESVLQDVADVMARMPDGAEKTALAMQLFGKSGTDMILMLNGGKTALQKMADEADRFGITISGDTARAAGQFNENLDRLSAAAGGLVMQLAAALAPTLEKLSQWAVEAATAFGQLSPETRAMVVQIGAMVGVVGLASAAFALLSAALSPVTVAVAAVAAGAALIYQNWEGIAAWFTEQWASITASTVAAWDAIKGAIGGAITYVTGLWDAFMAKLQAAVETAKAVGLAIKEALTFQAGEGQIQNGGALGAGPVPGPGWIQGNAGAGAAGADGLVDGFLNGVAQRQAEIDGAADSITNRVKSRWQIQSPSRVFHEIGGFLSEGLAQGITENKPMVDQAMDELGDGIEGKADSLASKLESFKSTFQNAFVGLVTGAMSFKEAIGQIATSLAKMAAEAAFQQLFGNLFKGGGFLGKLFGFADGGAFSGGRVMAFANGGVVNGATAFGMQGGLGVMGEAGPEAIMPLARGKGGKLGVVAQGGNVSKVQLQIVEGDMFASKVRVISEESAMQVTRQYDREVAPGSRNRPPRERG